MSDLFSLLDVYKLPFLIKLIHKVNTFFLSNFRDKFFKKLTVNGGFSGFLPEYTPKYIFQVYLHFLSIPLIIFEIPAYLLFNVLCFFYKKIIDKIGQKAFLQYNEVIVFFIILFAGVSLFVSIQISALILVFSLKLTKKFVFLQTLWFALPIFSYMVFLQGLSISSVVNASSYLLNIKRKNYINYGEIKIKILKFVQKIALFFSEKNINDISLLNLLSRFFDRFFDKNESIFKSFLNIHKFGNGVWNYKSVKINKSILDLLKDCGMFVLYVSLLIPYRVLFFISIIIQQKVMEKLLSLKLFKNHAIMSYLALILFATNNLFLAISPLVILISFIIKSEYSFFYHVIMPLFIFPAGLLLLSQIDVVLILCRKFLVNFKNSFIFNRYDFLYLLYHKLKRHFQRDVDEDFKDDNLEFIVKGLK